MEQAEEEEREERRRTAIRLQEEQKAILDRQRTEARKHIETRFFIKSTIEHQTFFFWFYKVIKTAIPTEIWQD